MFYLNLLSSMTNGVCQREVHLLFQILFGFLECLCSLPVLEFDLCLAGVQVRANVGDLCPAQEALQQYRQNS